MKLSQDVRAVQDKLATGEEQSSALFGRLSALEERATVLSAGAQASTPAAAVQGGAPTLPVQGAAAITTGSILQRATSAVPPQDSRKAAPTLSLTDPVVAPQTAPVLQQPKATHAVQLSAGSNLDALRLNWSLLSERHRELLGALQTRYRHTAGKPNAPYQLIAGPVRSTADAARICKELATSGVSCRATTFSGEAL